MSEQVSWLPHQVDEEVPSAARVYDYLLGGAHNFAADRELGEKFLAALPSARNVARLNRAFLRRAVEYFSAAGIRQFLDIGSGVPTVGNVHEVAHELDPASRVLYVDSEPVAVAHSELILDGNHQTGVVRADMLAPDGILNHPETQRLLDFSEPIGLLMVGVFHFVPFDTDALGLVRRYRDALASGSFLALSHFTRDIKPDEMDSVAQVMRQSADPIYPRTHAEIAELFEGFDLVQPGVVGTASWRPDEPHRSVEQPGAAQIYAGVGSLP